MAFVAKARVEVTATVSGTGAVTSMVANTSRIGFGFLSDADYTYGYIEQGSLWEECTLTKSGSTLVRSNVTASSSGGSSVSFNGSSSSTVFVDIPLSKLLIAQADGTFANADALLGTVTLNTLTALKNAPLPASTGYARYVRGLASATDGNGGWYYWDSADATAGDDYLYVVSNVSGTGRWIRVKQQLDPATAANDGAVKTGAVARVSTYLRSKHATHGALYVPEAYSYVKAIFDTYAAFKAVASTVWANGDRVAFNGITAKNDAPYHEGVYASASTNTDALDILFLRPDDISGSNPGRLQFTEPATIAKFADGDSSPTVKGARNFRASDAGTTITALDDAIDLQTYTIFPGAANTQFTHSSSFVMPGNANFTLYTAANGGSPVQIRYDNGIGYLMGGGGAGSLSGVQSTTLAALADVGNAINTSGKSRGKQVFDETDRLWFALAGLAASKWRPLDDMGGGSDITPA